MNQLTTVLLIALLSIIAAVLVSDSLILHCVRSLLMRRAKKEAAPSPTLPVPKSPSPSDPDRPCFLLLNEEQLATVLGHHCLTSHGRMVPGEFHCRLQLTPRNQKTGLQVRVEAWTS